LKKKRIIATYLGLENEKSHSTYMLFISLKLLQSISPMLKALMPY